jgi:alkyl hydroperoxide reductase subunit AhpF
MTAAVYTLRKGLSTALVTGNVGGQMTETAGIENYLGYRYINGNELVDKFREQVMQFGIRLRVQPEGTAARTRPGTPGDAGGRPRAARQNRDHRFRQAVQTP